MPAARFRTKLQEADNHDKRAVELADKEDVECVSNCLLVNPESIRHVMNKLRSMGHDLEMYRGEAGQSAVQAMQSERDEKAASAQRQGVHKRQKTLKEQQEADLASIQDDFGNPVIPEKLIPLKYWHIDKMRPTYMCSEVLNHIEPISLSTANLKAKLMKKGVFEQGAVIMLEIFEMCTGYPRAYKLRKQMCIHEKFLEDCLKQNKLRGRRCATLTLPPNWNIHGLYQISQVEERIIVKQVFTLDTHDVTHDAAMPEWSQLGDLYIEANYSETSATLRSRIDSDTVGILLARLFPPVLQSKPTTLPPLEEELKDIMDSNNETGALVNNTNPDSAQVSD